MLALALVALAVVPGCRRSDQVALQPVHRLASLLDPPLASDVPPRCEVADEFRPSIGCLPFITMLNKTMPRPPGGEVRVTADVPDGMRGGMMILEPRLRTTRDWQRTPTVVMPPTEAAHADVVLPIPSDLVGGTLGVQVFGRPVPPNEQSFTTQPVKLGRGAVLSVGLALHPLAAKLGGSPVEFRLAVESTDGPRDLIDDTLDPLHDKGWSEHTADLGTLAGQTVRFRFATRVIPRAGADPAASFGLPLWGAPQIVEPRRRDGRRNVVLISLDTLRGDHLDGSLDGIPIMPELRRIAERGTAFENAFSTYPSTSASHMTMFTGLYPSTHQVVFATHTLAATIPTLPEILAAHGYATVGVTEDAMLAAQAGFMRGFDYYREFKGRTMWETVGQIEKTFSTGLRWIEQHPGERFFLFLHTYEVHTPYEPPAEYDVFKTWERDGTRAPIDASAPKFVVDRHRYAGEAHYTDVVVKQLFDRLAELGVLDDTIVVVTSDHGDEFGEHGMIGHAKTAYDEVLHVPLVIVAPGVVPRGKRVTTPVSLVDLMPTLLSLVHVDLPPDVQGRSLLPLLRGTPFPQQRVLYAEAPPWGSGTGRRVSARIAGFKWIASDVAGVPAEIYDLTVDPGEKARVSDPALVAVGEELVRAYRASDAVQTASDAQDASNGKDAAVAKDTPNAKDSPAEDAPLVSSKPELDERTIEKLKHLGYVE
jgi:arylsulfatase A-like enzyme